MACHLLDLLLGATLCHKTEVGLVPCVQTYANKQNFKKQLIQSSHYLPINNCQFENQMIALLDQSDWLNANYQIRPKSPFSFYKLFLCILCRGL